MKKIILLALFLASGPTAIAQEIGDSIKVHNMEEVSVTHRRKPNRIAQGSILKTEVTNRGGIAKMACCTLAESFENSAAVSVGYSDAVSGAKQIKMLGLSGIYTQMLDESRPIMRGLSAPYSLSYTPGAWLNSIQTSKGVSSVIAGHEAITGQINIEPRKPTDTERLFVNAYFDQDMRAELNVTSAIPVVADRLSTIMMAHGSKDFTSFDHNDDGFMDMPMAAQINFANRWLYTAANGMQIRGGAKFVRESRKGGQMDSDFSSLNNAIWSSKIENKLFNAYLKAAMPTDTLGSNVALVVDYSNYDNDSHFGHNFYNAKEHSILANVLYSLKINATHSLTVGASATFDRSEESIIYLRRNLTPNNLPEIGEQPITTMNEHYWQDDNDITGAFAEYTYNFNDKLTAIAGIRADYANFYGWFYTPRAHLKWSITDGLVLRSSAGYGYRASKILSDNMWVLPLGRQITTLPIGRDMMEKALTFGGSLTQNFRLGFDHDASISIDVFRTEMQNTIYADQEITPLSTIKFYNTKGHTTTYQADFSWTPFERFDILATFRYNDSYVLNHDGEWIEKPLIDSFKGLLNLQYATKFRRWVFDATAQINGKSRLPQVAGVHEKYSPVYPMFYAQVTRKFKGVEIYLGCENIGDYTQHNPILFAEEPFKDNFNPSVIWGPLMGRKFYAGMRFTLDTF